MTKRAPNIIVVFNDDHGSWAVGPYGNRQVHTPTLDYLSSQGVTMLNAFTPTPVCSPARACFLTGRLASQHGLHDYVAGAPEFRDTRWLTGHKLISEHLARAGYRVGLSGKWHLGRDYEVYPGFHDWFALDGSYPVNHGGEHGFSVNGKIETLSGYKTQIITDRAVSFLRAQDRTQPFFLFVGYTATHSPWSDHPERLVERFRGMDLENNNAAIFPYGRPSDETAFFDLRNWRELLAQYYAAIAGLDEGVGRILDELDALSLRDDTLIVYTSDHGLCGGHHGLWGKSNSTQPVNFVEESIRIPMIFNGPDLFPAQRRLEFVDHLDLYQTLMDFALGAPESASDVPGRSFARMLKGQDAQLDWKAAQFCEFGNARMIRTAWHKLVWYSESDRVQLFDLRADPGETLDVSGEPKNAQRVTNMKKALDGHFGRFEVSEKSGLNVYDLPNPNFRESWE